MKSYLPEYGEETTLFFSSFEKETTPACDPADWNGDKGLTLTFAPGPSDPWIGAPDTGISGPHTLAVVGAPGIEKESVLLFDHLALPVSRNTVLTYHIFPAFVGEHYDYDYTGMFFAPTVHFSDGTTATLTDQNGNGLTPKAQGESRTLYTHQWNQIYASLGAYAGKTVEKITLDYEMTGGNRAFVTYFDDFHLCDKEPDRRTRPCHWATIFRGTNDSPAFSHGLTAPAVTMPQGFSMVGPCTNYNTSKHYDWLSDNLLCMTVSHEPSIWIGDRGTWQFMINTTRDTDSPDFSTHTLKNKLSHKKEIGLAHYDSVEFDENGGDAACSKLEMTATCHGAALRLTYGEHAKHHSLIFDSHSGDSRVTFGADGSFVAYTDHKSNGSGRLCFYGHFDHAPVSTAVRGRTAIAVFDAKVVTMTFAGSYIDYAQAKHTFALELSGKSFDALAEEAATAWDEIFYHITDIRGARTEQVESVYSALYYLYKYPNLLSENAGSAAEPRWIYRSPYSGKVEEGVMYINNGFWDTYRTAWAGYSLFTPEKMPTLLNGFLCHFKDQDWIPRWSAPGGVNCMVGTSSDVIFADALVKGFDFDVESAYRSAIKDGAVYPIDPRNGGRTKMECAPFLGYTPGKNEDFSWSMEGYINDYGIARMAEILAKRTPDPIQRENYEADAAYYRRRALNYVLLFCDGEGVENKWFRGREADGSLTRGNNTRGVFDPCFWGNDFTETDAYNMTVSAVHDGKGLANLYGGPAAMAKKLDACFETKGVHRGYGATDERSGIHEQREAREVKLGRFGISNQPSHHIIYMYNHTTDHYKAQKYARDCTKRLFVGGRFGQGYPGDEDNGEMSCWYLFSCLGFYPVCIGSGEYTIGSPAFSEIAVHFADKTLRIIANNNSDTNVYIQSARFNGEPLDSCVLTHEQIAAGGVLEFEMGPEPSDWGVHTAPSSLTAGEDAPRPWRDKVAPTTPVSVVTTFTTTPVREPRLFTDIGTLSAAFDNTSKTEAVLGGHPSTFVYSSPTPVKVDAVTLTSPAAAGTSIASLSVYGADNDGAWKTLGQWTDLDFEWAQYTRPFLLTGTRPYCHYKVTLEGCTAVSEVELLGE